MKYQLVKLSFLLMLLNGMVRAQTVDTGLIDKLVSDLFKRHLFNGAIVVGQKGRILFSKGYGFSNFQDAVPFTPSTSSDGGSNAKTFTATAVLILAEEKKLNLNDPVQRYLPEYPYSHTTVKNLITHSLGGLPDYDYFFSNADDSSVITTTSNLNTISKNKPALAYPPTTNFYYDNVGFDLAALIIERVTGLSYEQYLKNKIFGPLKMDSTFVRPAWFSEWTPGRTIGYKYQNDSLRIFDIAEREGFYGGCNLWFTANDLYRWGESFYYHSLLSESLVKKITSPVFINGRRSYVRLGAWYPGKTKTAFYYWGNVAGFYSWVYWDRDKQFTIAFMTNTAMPQWVRPLFTSALIDIMENRKYRAIQEPVEDLIDRKNLQQIVGTYNIDKLGKAMISTRDSNVILKLNGGMEYRMHLVDNKSFYIPGFDPWISFSSVGGGKFQHIHLSSTILEANGIRISN